MYNCTIVHGSNTVINCLATLKSGTAFATSRQETEYGVGLIRAAPEPTRGLCRAMQSAFFATAFLSVRLSVCLLILPKTRISGEGGIVLRLFLLTQHWRVLDVRFRSICLELAQTSALLTLLHLSNPS